jgi:hypothetical protein
MVQSKPGMDRACEGVHGVKVEFEMYDSRYERPAKSCQVLVFHASGLHYINAGANVHYSHQHDQFNNYDEFPGAKKKYGEDGKHRMYWAYFDDVKEAVRKAVNAERRKMRNAEVPMDYMSDEEVPTDYMSDEEASCDV